MRKEEGWGDQARGKSWKRKGTERKKRGIQRDTVRWTHFVLVVGS